MAHHVFASRCDMYNIPTFLITTTTSACSFSSPPLGTKTYHVFSPLQGHLMHTIYPTYAVLPSGFSVQYKPPAMSAFSTDPTLFYYSRASSVDDPVRSPQPRHSGLVLRFCIRFEGINILPSRLHAPLIVVIGLGVSYVRASGSGRSCGHA